MKIKDIISFKIVKEKIQIDMKDFNLKGDIIDVGVKNYGIIYKICKQYEDEVAVEYVMNEEKSQIEKDYYDTAVLFFSLSALLTAKKRKYLIKEIYQYIRDFGEIIIWDLNKPFGTIMDLEAEVLMPENEVKVIKIKDLNPLKRMRKEHVKDILSPFFDITEEKEGKSTIYIRGTRKGKRRNESIIDRA